jgi:hypothetical protein
MLAAFSTRVREVEIRRFRVAKVSQPETCLRFLSKREACGYLATLANHHKKQDLLAHA